MPKTNGNINFDVNMNVNKNGLSEVTKPLKQIQQQLNAMSTDKMSNEFQQAAKAAKQLESIINSSWNDKLGQLNLDKFNNSVKDSFGNVSKLRETLSGAGTSGQQAFNNLAHSVLNTNLELKESNKLLDSMATSMANTVKWGITSSIFNTITSSIQSAYYYAKDLDTSLNDIRIVTGDSADQMERFAKTANEAAGNLGRSTLDYTKAALSFYQQGLSDEEVEARTQVTLKAQNITGVGSEMVDYLTSVWNGFGATANQAEGYVDKLAKVADSSASDMSQLAIAMSKVASTANIMGVDVDQLTAQLATVIATTRQAPEAVGTAFKTIYARLNDISTGADEAEISLGNYSGKMAAMGFNVLDTNGKLRDTGQVIEQIGSRWATLTRQQQISIGQIMGGQRQVNQIVSLFNNWETYSKLLNDSLSAQGTLTQKNDVYLESTAAHMKELSAQVERLYDALINQDSINTFADTFKGVLSTFNDFVEGIGGGTNAFVNFGAILANVFNQQIGTAINNQIKNFETFKANLAQIKAQKDISNEVLQQTKNNHILAGDNVSQAALQKEAAIAQKTLDIRKALTQQQYNRLQSLQQEIAIEQTKIDNLSQYKNILNSLNIDENASSQIIQDHLEYKQQELDLQKLIADYIQLSMTPSKQLTEAQQQRVTLADDILLDEGRQAAILVGMSAQQEQIVNKLQTEVLSNDQLKQLLDQQNKLIQNQEEKVNNVTKALEGRKAAEDGTLDSMRQQQEIRERNIVKQQQFGNRQLRIQNIVKATSAIVQGLSGVMGGISTALDQSATASQRLNGGFSAVSSGLGAVANYIAPGSGIIVQGAISILQQTLKISGAWDFLARQMRNSSEILDDLNEKTKAIHSAASGGSQSISSLKELEEEWDTLSTKAGAYGKNIDDLTQEEKNRYYEIIDKFTEYNDTAIAGYDAQGNKIIANNDALKETIRLLEQKHEKEVQDAMGNVHDYLADEAFRANQPRTNVQSSQNELGQLQASRDATINWTIQSNGVNEEVYSKLKSQMINRNANLIQAFDKLSSDEKQKIQEKLSETLGFTNGDVQSWFKAASSNLDISNVQTEVDNFNEYQKAFISLLEDSSLKSQDLSQIQGTQNFKNFFARQIGVNEDLLNNIQETEQLLQSQSVDLDNATKLNAGVIMNVLKYADGYNQAWKELATEDNQDQVQQIMLNYLDSFTYDPNALSNEAEKIVNSPEALVQFGQKYAQQLKLVFDQTSTAINSTLDNYDFDNFEGTVEEYVEATEKAITETLSKLDENDFKTEKAREALAGILEQTFDLKNIKIDFKNGDLALSETEDTVSNLKESLQKDIDKVFSKLEKDFGFKGNKEGINVDLLSNLLGPQDVNNFNELLDQINWGSFYNQIQNGATVAQAFTTVLKQAKEASENASSNNLSADTVYNSDEIIKSLTATKKLGEEEEAYLSTLEEQDEKLSHLATVYGRNSDLYIKRLREVARQKQKNYKEQLQNDRKAALERQKLAEEELKYAKTDEAKQQAENKVQTAKQQVINLNYEIAKSEHAIAEIEQQRAATAEDLALKKAKEKANVQANAESALQNLQSGNALSGNDLSALAELERVNTNLLQIAEQHGRYSFEYEEALERQLSTQTSITEQARQEALAILEAKKARLQQRQEEFAKDNSLISDDDYVNQLMKSEDDRDYDLIQKYESQNQLREQYLKIEEEILDIQSQIAEQQAAQQSISQGTLDKDVERESWRALSEEIYKNADAIQELSEQLMVNQDAAEDVAESILRYDKALEAVSKDYDNWQQLLSSGNMQEAVTAGQQLKNVYSDLLDLPFENLSPDFTQSINNLNLLKQAANGSEEAYNQLREAAYQDIIAHLGIDDSDLAQFDTTLNDIQSRIANGIDDIQVGATIDTADAYVAMNQLINAADMTAQQATDLLSSMGIDAQVESVKVDQPERRDFISAVPEISHESVSVPNIVQVGGIGAISTTSVDVPTISYRPDVQSQDGNSTKTATALRVKSAKKSSGGGVKFNNSSYGAGSRGQAARTPSGGKGSGGGGGGGGSKPKTKPRETRQKDLYAKVNAELSKIGKSLNHVNSQRQKMIGKGLKENLKAELKLLQQQLKVQEKKAAIARGQANALKSNLKSRKAEFGSDGELLNSEEVLDKALKEYNKKIKKYNKLSAEEQQRYEKTTLNKAKLKYEDTKKWVERYMKLWSEEIPQLQNQMNETLDKQIEVNVKKFHIDVELDLDMAQAQRDFNEFRRKVVDQISKTNILGNTKYDVKDLQTYIGDNGRSGTIASTAKHVNDIMKELNLMDKGKLGAIYQNDRAAAVEDLKKYTKQLSDDMINVQELIENIQNSVYDLIDEADEAFDRQLGHYDQINGLLDHNMELVKLLYGDEAYASLTKYYDQATRNNEKQLREAKSQTDLWHQRVVAEKEYRDSLAKGSVDWEKSNKLFEAYREKWEKSVNSLNEYVSKSIENIQAKYANSINDIFKQWELSITSNKGTRYISEQWELINKQSKMYLDKINSIYAIEKLKTGYQDLLQKNLNNLSAQRSINELMENQLKYLRDKDKLSQYDVDRANKILQIETKRLALEQTAQAKSQLRLRRDSQGNYTYEYVNDQDEITKARQELSDAENELYNLTRDNYNNNLDSYYNLIQEWEEKVKEAYLDTTLTAAQQGQKVTLLNKYYGEMINDTLNDNNQIRNNLIADAITAIAGEYSKDEENFTTAAIKKLGISEEAIAKFAEHYEKDNINFSDMVTNNVQAFERMAGEEGKTMTQKIIPTWDSGIQDMITKMTEQGGLEPTTLNSFSKIRQAVTDYGDELNRVEGIAQADFQKIRDGEIDPTTRQTENLTQATDNLTESYRDQFDSLDDVLSEVRELKTAYDKLKTSYTNSASAGFNYMSKLARYTDKVTRSISSLAEQLDIAASNAADLADSLSDAASYDGGGGGGYGGSGDTGYEVQDPTPTPTTDNRTGYRDWMHQPTSNSSSNINKQKQNMQYLKEKRRGFSTGGYTGDWHSSEGKIAILHEKELVLNKKDTENMLSAVNIVRSMNNLLDNISGNFTLPSILSSVIGGITSSSNTSLDQNVHIEASFPGVKDRFEIEQAFDNLLNRASQYINRK